MADIKINGPYQSHYDMDCEECGDSIYEDDNFYYGNNNKLCPDCTRNLIED